MRLRLDFAQLAAGSVLVLDGFRTTVGVMPRYAGSLRVAAGFPEESLLLDLPSTRGKDQMPAVGTQLTDDVGLRGLREWISAMPSARPHTPVARTIDADRK